MKMISLERLLVESSNLQDHRQRRCVMRKVTVENVESVVRFAAFLFRIRGD